MRLNNDKILIIPFEPIHARHIYRWFHSGDYENCFADSNMLTTVQCAQCNDRFMIVNIANADEVYGTISFQDIKEKSRNLKLGILIDKKYQNKGFGLDGLKIISYYIFNCLNYYKIKAEVIEDNLLSHKLFNKFGFIKEEGIAVHDIYVNGEFKNIIRYYILKGQFNKKYKSEIEASASSGLG